MKHNDQMLERLLFTLSGLRVPMTGSEYDLHAMIAASLTRGGFVFSHEAVLGPRCRIDFLAEGIGIEVKRGKPARKQLLEQCTRYLSCEQVRVLVLVVEKNIRLPDSICGKPLIVFGLNRLWGVALP